MVILGIIAFLILKQILPTSLVKFGENSKENMRVDVNDHPLNHT